ncbi:MAG: hypothetical protein LBK68_02370 [Candidatus Margulisbacteria bacterium]|jgi:hypothetical protein|nr:hypothetical protein [Candidatus Margulisiibacteriota bacterium]
MTAIKPTEAVSGIKEWVSEVTLDKFKKLQNLSGTVAGGNTELIKNILDTRSGVIR